MLVHYSITYELYIRLVIATFIGLVIGLERAYKNKPAGY